ncbi:DUF1320 domain-containing protein [Parabacteroides merdae]|jgi:phage gp36-like protein|uniref:DUF1320 domain-containing protein n=1 Tax=Parabacteroides merdae TaxID=46503 RepID=A0A413NNZ6_9BACT|nr:phage protein Gp36 family protein [Parabacteroides merdae]ECO5453742.1 DUF1320 domain-containing protein [Campylobacter coli]RGZ50283.1 DUF1320 domain-containing protein [Parabacteroides merdae]RHH74690.1 DUF1320 domain-containing protein [Parabacteroides merdae]DAY51085.1 MAG TPA: head to tail adaptor [Caudoviricetes sp.]
MFIEISELNTVAAEYKVEEITDYDSSIAQQCILAAVKRVRRLLSGRYDVDAIFSTTGEERDAELVEICKNIALWFLIRRCNVDILYNRVKETYDRDMAYLRELKEGSIPSDLPLRETDGQPVSMLRAGSNRKFSHSW